MYRKRMARRLAREWKPGKQVICDHDWELDVIVVYDHTDAFHLLVVETEFADEYIDHINYSLWFLSKRGSSLVHVWDEHDVDMPPYTQASEIVTQWKQLEYDIYEMEIDND